MPNSFFFPSCIHARDIYEQSWKILSRNVTESDEGKDSGIYLDQQKVMESLLSQEASSNQFCDDPLSSFV